MSTPSTSRIQTRVAWAAVCAALIVLALPIGGYSWHLAQTAQELRLSNAKLEALVGRRPALEARQNALQSDSFMSAALVPGASEAVASATIQERVRLITEAAGGSLDSARIRPAERTGAFEKIAMTVRVSSDTDGLAKILSELEYGRPAITVEKLAVRANRNMRRMSNAEPSVGTDLIATIDLSAWRRP